MLGAMLKTNLKIAYRNLLKRKEFAFINILGLGMGIASCILIFLFVKNEYSYDKSFQEAEQIYKVILERKYPDQTDVSVNIPHSFAKAIKEDYAEVENTTTFSGPFDDMMISFKDANSVDIKFLEQGVFVADSNFFKVFSFKTISGDLKNGLSHPRSMVLTQSTARRHFRNVDPVGKT